MQPLNTGESKPLQFPNVRKTKIVCTLGPATSTRQRIEELIQAGMNVARLNFSHGTQEEHLRTMGLVRQCAADLGVPVAILQDLQGPRIRTGRLRGGGPVLLQPGAPLTITTRDVEGDASTIATNYPGLPADVRPGDTILMDDGRLEVRVEAKGDDEVRCQVVRGGPLGERKGMNLPGVHISARGLTEKDQSGLRLGIQQQVDYVALSFVRGPDDVAQARDFLRAQGADIPLIAKLEKPEALTHLEAILDAADGVMVARGDLAVELSLEKVPAWQKRIIRLANQKGALVITATQMLETMVSSPVPTRAEVSDVANAVFDGTDAVMLSSETSIGQYPVESVRIMDRIVRQAEAEGYLGEALVASPDVEDYAHAIGRSAHQIAESSPGVRAIVPFTLSGFTARMASKSRPATPIIALTPYQHVVNRMALYWGVTPWLCRQVRTLEELLATVDAILGDQPFSLRGANVVVLGGLPVPAHVRTNFLKVHKVGEDLQAQARP